MAISQWCLECVNFGDCPGMKAGTGDEVCGEFKSLYEEAWGQEERFREFASGMEEQQDAA